MPGIHNYMVVAIHTVRTSSTSLSPTSSTTVEEKVFAVQYRKIKFTWFDWFWGRDLDGAYLDDHSRWTVINGIRNDATDGEDIEAELQSSLTAEDVELEGEVFQDGDLMIILEP